MNWKPGDAAIVQTDSPGLDAAGVSGQRCVLISYLGDILTGSEFLQNAWRVQMANGEKVWVATRALRKPDQYDGNQISTWDQCAWKPKELVGC